MDTKRNGNIIYGQDAGSQNYQAYYGHQQPNYATQQPNYTTQQPNYTTQQPNYYYTNHPENVYNPYTPNVPQNNYTPYTHQYGPNTQGQQDSRIPLDYGLTDEQKYFDDNTDIIIRHGFVRKVYGILGVQLLLTFGIACIFVFSESAAVFLINNWFILLIAMIFSFGLVIALSCCRSIARSYPLNYILLYSLSIAEGIIIGYASLRVSTLGFLMAVGITGTVVLALSIFAIQTKYDFTGCYVFVLVSALILILFAFIGIFIRSKIYHLVVAAISTLIICFYIIYDTQQIVGGKRREYQLCIDDYAYGALSLYLDIVTMFLLILQFIGILEQSN